MLRVDLLVDDQWTIAESKASRSCLVLYPKPMWKEMRLPGLLPVVTRKLPKSWWCMCKDRLAFTATQRVPKIDIAIQQTLGNTGRSLGHLGRRITLHLKSNWRILQPHGLRRCISLVLSDWARRSKQVAHPSYRQEMPPLTILYCLISITMLGDDSTGKRWRLGDADCQ